MRRALVLFLLSACSPTVTPPKAGALKAGVATTPLDVRIGTPMGGYSRQKPDADVGSKWALNFPSSTGIHSTPTARALALDNGLQKIVLVRIDAPLTTISLQIRSEQRLAETDADVKLVVAATHSHAGPARFFRSALSGGTSGLDITAVAMDKYDAEIEDRIARSIAAAAHDALGGLRRVAVGHGEADGSVLNNDRRCQNDALYGEGYRDKTLHVVRFDEVDEAGAPVKPFAALLDFAAHGTVLGSGNTLLSTDAPGALEAAASARLGVPVVYLQGSAGDVSPTYGGFEAMQALERFGALGAPLVAEAFEKAAPAQAAAESKLRYVERGVSTTRAGVGYAPREFPEFGAIGCGLAGSACDQELDPKTIICLPLSKTGVVQTPVAAVQIEDVLLVMLPGEPMTAIGEKLAKTPVPGVSKTLVVGYALDHSGYLLEEADFLRGGYEPSVTPWGWKFADHLVAEAMTMMMSLDTLQTPFIRAPIPALPEPRAAEVLAAQPSVLESPPATLERLQLAKFRFIGTEETPVVRLERDGVAVNEPVVLRLKVTPTYAAEPKAASRTFEYVAEWETAASTPLGRYRFRTGSLESTEVELKPSTAVVSATLSPALELTMQLPANPVKYLEGGDPVGGYRMRGPARGGALMAKVTDPSGAVSMVQFSGSDTTLKSSMTASAGHWTVEIAPGAYVDADGNSNAASIRAEANH